MFFSFLAVFPLPESYQNDPKFHFNTLLRSDTQKSSKNVENTTVFWSRWETVFGPPPAKADIATAILTNVIEHLVLLFCPPISTPSPPKRCGRILMFPASVSGTLACSAFLRRFAFCIDRMTEWTGKPWSRGHICSFGRFRMSYPWKLSLETLRLPRPEIERSQKNKTEWKFWKFRAVDSLR